MPQTTLVLDKDLIRTLTYKAVKASIYDFERMGRGSFVITDLPGLGARWDSQFVPFYNLYNQNGKVAGQEMGKILSSVAKELGLRSVKENKRGKRDAITRYFFQ